MTFAFIGHRGVGKSSLMKRLKTLSKSTVKWVDLDREIEAQHGNLKEIFEQKGEAYFREIEADVFKAMFRLYGQQKTVFVFGAGFPVEKIPDQLKAIWIRRRTDQDGRVFLDRPRLNKNVSAWQESIELFQKRNDQFLQRCDFVYDLPEGIYESSQEEIEIFKNLGILEGQAEVSAQNYFITVPESHLKARSADLIKSFEGHLEFNSKDWDLSQLAKVLENFNFKAYDSSADRGNLLSLRDSKFAQFSNEEKQKLLRYFESVDMDVEHFENLSGESSFKDKKLILSSHIDQIDEALRSLSSKDRKKFHFKLCPLVENWDDFYKGYLWWKNDPANRSYLPRSKNGQWQWFRVLASSLQKLNFIAGFNQNIADQPSLLQISLRAQNYNPQFAAVLGNPVHHSQSPTFHSDFFHQHKIPYLAIPITEADFEKAMTHLTFMGLRYASVTSPLKRKVYRWITEKSSEAHAAQAINTLTYKESSQSWVGDQTDLKGLQNHLASANIEAKKVCIWGGGGVLELLKLVFPQAEFFPARQALANAEAKEFDLLVWASPRSQNVQWPPESWKIKLIYDLNYAENSMGKEYAALSQAPYQSGLDFFKEQALEQQKIWRSCL